MKYLNYRPTSLVSMTIYNCKTKCHLKIYNHYYETGAELTF